MIGVTMIAVRIGKPSSSRTPPGRGRRGAGARRRARCRARTGGRARSAPCAGRRAALRTSQATPFTAPSMIFRSKTVGEPRRSPAERAADQPARCRRRSSRHGRRACRSGRGGRSADRRRRSVEAAPVQHRGEEDAEHGDGDRDDVERRGPGRTTSAPCSSTPRNTGSSHSVRNSKFVERHVEEADRPRRATRGRSTATTIVHGISCGSSVERRGRRAGCRSRPSATRARSR